MSGQLTKEGTQAVPQQAFVRYNDPHGNELAAINRDGSLTFTQTNYKGVTTAKSSTSSVPVVNGSINQSDINTAQTVIDGVNVDSVMHLVGVYASSDLDGGGSPGDHVLTITISWKDFAGNSVSTEVGTIDGVDPNASFVSTGEFITPKIGTSIEVSTAYTSGSPGAFHYNLSVVIVQYPNIAQLSA